LLQNAKTALAQKDYPVARALAEQMLETEPQSIDALLVAGEAAARLGDNQVAMDYYLRVPDDGSEGYVTSRWAAGNIALAEAGLSRAEELFRAALATDPGNIISHERLAFILGVEGRHWEALPHLFEPIRKGRIALEPLVVLGAAGSRNVMNPQVVFQATETAPDDPLPTLGLARVYLDNGDLEEAERLIRDVLQRRPELVEAHAVLGQIVVERADAAQVKTWIANLPEDAKQHPEIWYWLGVWAAQQQDLRSAARCLWETVKLQPNHLEANRRLSQQLKQLGRDEDAKPFAERAAKLELLKPLLDDLYALRENINPDKAMLDKMIQAAEMTEGLGRLWEAWAWYQLVLVVEPKNTRALKQVQRLGAEVSKIAEQVIPDAQPARFVDLGNIPLPDWNAVTPSPES
jgi:thioredoxin-like negative regulator of GroEL